MDEHRLRRCLRDEGVQVMLECHESLDSTNIRAAELCKEGRTDALVVSEEQIKGRGRRGRSFCSPKACGAYFSILLKLRLSREDFGLISLAAANAVHSGITSVTGIDVEIKWINDIFFKKRKVGGIMVEALGEISSGKEVPVVIGIGINCAESKEVNSLGVEAGALGIATDMREALIARITKNIMDLKNGYNGEDVIARYKEHCMTLGSNITVYEDAEKRIPAYNAKAIDIADTGELVVQTEMGELKLLNSGEVSTGLSL